MNKWTREKKKKLALKLSCMVGHLNDDNYEAGLLKTLETYKDLTGEKEFDELEIRLKAKKEKKCTRDYKKYLKDVKIDDLYEYKYNQERYFWIMLVCGSIIVGCLIGLILAM